MKFKKVLVWSNIVGSPHPELKGDELAIKGTTPIISVLFPGINYYSITGFGKVKEQCLVPVLKKLFPELASLSAQDVDAGEMVEVNEFLPSKGYEWEDSQKWQRKLKKLLMQGS